MNIRMIAALSVAAVLSVGLGVSTGHVPVPAGTPSRTEASLPVSSADAPRSMSERLLLSTRPDPGPAARQVCKANSDCPKGYTCCTRHDGSTLCATACPAD